MKNILCFGDSNTWGYSPETGERFDDETRWTALTPLLLNNEYRFYEAGLNGRTVNSDDALRPFRNGLNVINLYLESCRPLDVVIIMLGTNDLKASLNLSIEMIKNQIADICQQVKRFDYTPYSTPKILLIAPAPFVSSINLDDEFVSTITASKELARHYYEVAQALKLEFLDAGRVLKSSNLDGIHWDAESHRDFANHLAAMLKQLC